MCPWVGGSKLPGQRALVKRRSPSQSLSWRRMRCSPRLLQVSEDPAVAEAPIIVDRGLWDTGGVTPHPGDGGQPPVSIQQRLHQPDDLLHRS